MQMQTYFRLSLDLTCFRTYVCVPRWSEGKHVDQAGVVVLVPPPPASSIFCLSLQFARGFAASVRVVRKRLLRRLPWQNVKKASRTGMFATQAIFHAEEFV